MTVSAPPTWLSVIPENIPRELTSARAWYPAIIRPKKNAPGKWDKRPGNPVDGSNALWSDPATRCSFSDAYMAYQSGRFGGIGYMMHNAGLTGVDLDGCVSTDGTIAPWAQAIVDSFPGAYWERSISGTGLRGFCLGVLPDNVGGRRSKIEGCSVEVYTDERFLVVTGQAVRLVDELVNQQPAIDALYARLGAGRVRATGTAAASGLTGRVSDHTQDEVDIIGGVMGSRFGARLLEIWSRDELDVAGASEDDWALEQEIAWQAIGRGFAGDELALTVERIMRTGPYRSKWDEARGAVTWLAQDVANAIATVQKRREKYQTGPVLDLEDDAPTDETIEQEVVRLRRELALARASLAVKENENRILREKLKGWKAVLSNPKLKPVDRIAALPVIEDLRAAQRIGQDEVHVRLPGIVKGWGIPESTLSKSTVVLTEAAGAPLSKRYGRGEPVQLDNGDIVTPPKVMFRAEVEGDLYAAVGSYDPGLPKRGGKRPELPQCKDHPNADLIIRTTTHCAECRKPLERSDKTLHRQNEGLGEEGAPPVIDGTYGLQNDGIGGHDGAEQSERAGNVVPMVARQGRLPDYFTLPADLEVTPAPPDPTTWMTYRPCCETPGVVRNLDGGGWTCTDCGSSTAPQGPPVPKSERWRCTALVNGAVCGSLNRDSRVDGSWRCDGCGARGGLARVAGGEE